MGRERDLARPGDEDPAAIDALQEGFHARLDGIDLRQHGAELVCGERVLEHEEPALVVGPGLGRRDTTKRSSRRRPRELDVERMPPYGHRYGSGTTIDVPSVARKVAA